MELICFVDLRRFAKFVVFSREFNDVRRYLTHFQRMFVHVTILSKGAIALGTEEIFTYRWLDIGERETTNVLL